MLRITQEAAEYAGRWMLSAANEAPADVTSDLQSGWVLLAVVGATAVAAVRCRLTTDPASDYVKRLAVVPAWRRRGIGRLLMDAAETQPAAAGARCATLGTVAENAALTAFYLSLGYGISDTKPVPHRGFTAHTWEKRLPGGEGTPSTQVSPSHQPPPPPVPKPPRCGGQMPKRPRSAPPSNLHVVVAQPVHLLYAACTAGAPRAGPAAAGLARPRAEVTAEVHAPEHCGSDPPQDTPAPRPHQTAAVAHARRRCGSTLRPTAAGPRHAQEGD